MEVLGFSSCGVNPIKTVFFCLGSRIIDKLLGEGCTPSADDTFEFSCFPS